MYAKLVASISGNRRLWITLLVLVALPFLIKPARLSSSAQGGQERTFKLYREHKDLPLEVRAVRNLQSENWHKDLEIEVKNVGKRPIYAIGAYLLFPDDKGAELVGVSLRYGNPENLDLRRYAEVEDPHLDPGDIYLLKIDEDLQKVVEARGKQYPLAYRRLELWITTISFGDGTGLVNGEPRDFRKNAGWSESPGRYRSRY